MHFLPPLLALSTLVVALASFGVLVAAPPAAPAPPHPAVGRGVGM